MIYFDFYFSKIFGIFFSSLFLVLPMVLAICLSGLGNALMWNDNYDHRPGWGTALFLTLALIMQIAFLRSDSTASMREHIVNKWNQTIYEYDEKENAEKRAATAVQLVDKTEVARFKLISWRPPKHFYVTLEAKDGQLYEMYVSKHCNNASKLVAGEEYNLSVTHYVMSNEPNKPRLQFNNLAEAFCY